MSLKVLNDKKIISDKKIKQAINVEHFVFDLFRKGVNIEEIGNIFENSLGRFERKHKGQYYTPKEIVDYMLTYLNIDEETRIVDPACGCGIFLVSIMEMLKSKYNGSKYENIYGVDLNPVAVSITRLSLIVKSGFNDELVNLFKRNIRVGNSIVSNKKYDNLAFQWFKEFPTVFDRGGFDIVIGNPPYVTLKKSKDFDPEESLYPHLINGPVNAATLMIGRGLEILKEGGLLAFVLPKTILRVESYSSLREYLLKNTKIIQIFDLGSKFKDVRGEQIILIIKKEKPTPDHEIIVRAVTNKTKSLFEQPIYKVKQSLFLKFNKILIFDDKKIYLLLDKITTGKTELSKIVNGSIIRGLPIKRNVLCTSEKTYNNDDYEKVVRGRSISKFKINEILYVDKDVVNKFSKNKLSVFYQKKIVLQNIFSSESGIIAAYDNQGILSLDTVTNIIITDDIWAKYILCLLNSKLINFYIIYGQYNCSKLTMHADRTYIGKIPIVTNPKKEYLKKAVELVDYAMKEVDINKIKTILRKIDEVVYRIYDLTIDEISLIEKKMGQILSPKSRW